MNVSVPIRWRVALSHQILDSSSHLTHCSSRVSPFFLSLHPISLQGAPAKAARLAEPLMGKEKIKPLTYLLIFRAKALRSELGRVAMEAFKNCSRAGAAVNSARKTSAFHTFLVESSQWGGRSFRKDGRKAPIALERRESRGSIAGFCHFRFPF